MQNPLQSSGAAGVSAGRQLTQIRLQILGAGQKADLELQQRHRTTGDFARTLVAADGGAAAGSTTPHRIHQNAHDAHQHQEAQQATTPEPEDRNDEGEAESAAAVTAVVATTHAAAAVAAAARHRGSAETAPSDAATTGCFAGLRHQYQQSDQEHWHHQARKPTAQEATGRAVRRIGQNSEKS